MDRRELRYEEHPGGSYYILNEEVILPKNDNIVHFSLKIDDWANRRQFVVDKAEGVTYFQASSESNGCYRCGICQKRMQLIGWRTGHTFVSIKGWYSLYQKREGVPVSNSKDDVRAYLGLAVTEATVLL